MVSNFELATGRPFTRSGRPCIRTGRPFTRTDQCGENPDYYYYYSLLSSITGAYDKTILVVALLHKMHTKFLYG